MNHALNQTTGAALSLRALSGLPMVRSGDDLPALIGDALERQALLPRAGDVVVVAQKIVSKAEGRTVNLADIRSSEAALRVAAEVGKDARLVEVILSESVRVVRSRPGLLIMQHRLGFVMANAGVDHSNVGPAGDDETVLLLPQNPDRSAEALRAALSARFSAPVGVIINDSFGRPWRRGTAGVAIGAAGLPSIVDLRGEPDLFGRPLEVTLVGYADQIAAAASLLMGEAREARPVVLVSGLAWSAPVSPAATLVRPAAEDLFR